MLAPPGDNRLLGLTSKSTANVGLRLSAVICLRARRTAVGRATVILVPV